MKHNLMFAIAVLAMTPAASFGNGGAASQVVAVEVYPGPGVDTYRSSLYRVDVQKGASWLPSYVYSYGRTSKTLWHWGTIPTVNFTTFGANGAATVRLSKAAGSISSADVSPKSKTIPVQITNGQAILTLRPGDKAWITLNGDDANPLFIFADNLKPSIPLGATYFGPGIRDISPATGNHYRAVSGEIIYLDGGAWLRGNIDVTGRTNVKIMGPGILSGDLWTSETVQALPTFDQMTEYAMIRGDWGGTNATLQDITIIDSPSYNVFAGTHQATNVKLLSPWYYSTDGFQAVNSVDQSFAFVGDNVFFPIWAGIANDNISVSNSFVGTTTNAVFCGGYWGNVASTYTATVNNIDIKTYNSDAWVQYGAPLTPVVFQVWVDNNNSAMGYSNQTYQNIRVEGNLQAPLAMLKNMVYPWGGANAYPNPMGNSYNLAFQNISVSGTQKRISEIKGLDAGNGFHNVTFQNLTINGTGVTQTNFRTYFDVNSFVNGLSFR